MKYIKDIEWLLKHKSNATAQDKDYFVEKVSIVLLNSTEDEETARKQVLEWLNERK